MTIGGVSVGRASVGTRDEIGLEQTINVMGDGSVRVRTTAPGEHLMTWQFPRLTNVQWEVLKIIVQDNCQFSAVPAVIVDDYGTSRTCRIWKDSLRGESRLGRFWSADLTVRVEN